MQTDENVFLCTNTINKTHGEQLVELGTRDRRMCKKKGARGAYPKRLYTNTVNIIMSVDVTPEQLAEFKKQRAREIGARAREKKRAALTAE